MRFHVVDDVEHFVRFSAEDVPPDQQFVALAVHQVHVFQAGFDLLDAVLNLFSCLLIALDHITHTAPPRSQ